ncbi:hypothetical protein Vretifemale_2910 [Volvox reticuliferus]|uniref:Uncharacterized protein n=1 Tax=Volvox reticuliferus TaxID=1737510 RepID=A0A8J4C208_9CHLO|nr:hypothetical protein Vretifemale_2910 [Volvox reticuliferus]
MADDAAAAQHARDEQKVVLGISNVRSFAAALHCVRAGNKQTCTVSISAGGVSVVWEDESKALQGSVFLKPELFSRFVCGAEVRHEFGLQLQLLLDTLALFASAAAPMTAYYPGSQGELVCEMNDSAAAVAAATGVAQRIGNPGGGRESNGRPGSVCTWARIVGLQAETVVDLGEYWTEPASSFLCQGLVLKGAIEDLEWPGGAVEVLMQQDPQRLMLSATGHGSLEVELPTTQISGFTCQQPEVRHSYKYRHCKAAFCSLPHPRDCAAVSTKVSVDVHGLLKVTHMLGLEPSAGSGGAGGSRGAHEQGTQASQRAYDNSKIAIVQFLLQPTEETT